MTDTYEDAVKRRARTIMLHDPNCTIYHWPGDTPRKWNSPGGAICDTHELSGESVAIKLHQARATLEADDAAGYALVPKVATEAMCKAAYRESPDHAGDVDSFHDEINAAIAAGAIRRDER